MRNLILLEKNEKNTQSAQTSEPISRHEIPFKHTPQSATTRTILEPAKSFYKKEILTPVEDAIKVRSCIF